MTARFEPSAVILADSIARHRRLTTFGVCFHRYVLAEFNTHRAFSRNGASSRAIPVAKMIERVRTSNVEPLEWGKNQTGMQAYEQLEGANLEYAKQAWNVARARAIDVAEALSEAGAHKQIVNRVLEPFMPMTMIVTTCDKGLENFFSQRAHHAAAPEIRELAYRMQEVYRDSEPRELSEGEWHMPYYSDELSTLSLADEIKACVGRCARVSYNNHEGVRDVNADLSLFNKLASATPPHWSPLEHVAVVYPHACDDRGNFCHPWLQLRKVYEQYHRGNYSDNMLPLVRTLIEGETNEHGKAV